jgi:hypothetical protein
LSEANQVNSSGSEAKDAAQTSTNQGKVINTYRDSNLSDRLTALFKQSLSTTEASHLRALYHSIHERLPRYWYSYAHNRKYQGAERAIGSYGDLGSMDDEYSTSRGELGSAKRL